MMKIVGVALAVAFAANTAFASTPYTIDPDHTRAQFVTRHMMVANVKGEFSNITGEVMLDEKDLTKSTVKVTIDARTVNTGVAKRDAHMKSAEFFDVEKFPTMSFESTKITKGKGNSFKVMGNLTIKGISKPITLDVDEFTAEIKGPDDWKWGVTRGISASTMVNRRDFELKWDGPKMEKGVFLGDQVKLLIQAEIKKAAPEMTPAAAAGTGETKDAKAPAK
jgi:polyisoprenoid-binding protein YceI